MILLSIRLVFSVILLILFSLTVIVLPVVCLVRRYRKRKTEYLEEAEALVLDCHKTGAYNNSRPQLKLQVNVMPETGRNFVAEITLFGEEKTISRGMLIKVIYNSHNHKEIKPVAAA